MCARTVCFLIVCAAFGASAFACTGAPDDRGKGRPRPAADAADGAEPDALLLVRLRPRQEVEAQSKSPPKLAPALVAVKDSGGVLKGCDEAGNPVIATARRNIEQVRSSPAVRAVSEQPPEGWQPVTRLTLNYEPGERPDERELKELGLRMVDDYGKGSFMTVEPVDRKIDAALAERLQRSAKVQYVSPSFRIKAIPPGKG